MTMSFESMLSPREKNVAFDRNPISPIGGEMNGETKRARNHRPKNYKNQLKNELAS